MKNPLRIIQNYNAKKELSEHAPKLEFDAERLSPNELVELINGEKWQRFFWIKQVESEIIALCQLVYERKPSAILEVGTASGGTLFLFSKLSSKDAHLISLDLPEGLYGGGYPKFKSGFYKSFATKNQRIDLIRGDSHMPQSLQNVKQLLGHRKLDFLFIDGDHSYEGVKKDFDLYAPLVNNGGMIAFHDISEHPQEWNVGVKKFWDEIKHHYSYKEFIESPSQGWAGIGVIFK